MSASEKALCPSSKCVSGAKLIGIVQADGSVAFLGSPQPVDQQFVAIASRGRAPEMRFRFANPCVRGACANWAGVGCGLAAKMTAAAELASPLPGCGIRSDCRWYAEQGGRACAICPEIVRGADRAAGPPASPQQEQSGDSP